ncbi:MAG: PDZ domain-containing protein [Bacteroidetes bacterium]|nr:MAG: PDZ domain-containing protein [Bacteroidota bacterium]
MKYFHYSFITLVLLFLLSPAAYAQKKVIREGGPQMWTSGGGDIVDIPELAIFISQEGEKISVTNVMDVNVRPKGYEDVDIQLEDIIMMANGKRVKNLSELKSFYEDSKPGTTINLGIKRGEKMLIASFDKADPEKLPKRKMIIRQSGDEDFLGIPQVGLFIASKGKKLVVSEVLENAKEELPGADVKQGDEVIKLNGKPLGSFKELSSQYEKLVVGDKVEFIISRSGREHTISFKKPKDEGGMKVIRRTVGE